MGRESQSEGGVVVAPATRDLSILAAQLADWLGGKMPGATNIRVENLAYPFGAGQSHETILFDARWDEAGQERLRGLVVRIKPTSFTVYYDDMFTEQYELMRVLHADGRVKVADTFWYEPDPTLLGAPFFVMEKLNGRVAVSVPSYMESGWLFDATPAQRERLWESSVRQLAAIQTVPLSSLAFLNRPDAGDGFDQEWDRWRRYLASVTAGRPIPLLDSIWRRLGETLPANRPPGLVWGDSRLGNMMVGDNFDVIAVMDWEQTSLGGALHDLAWWLMHEKHKIRARGGETLPGLRGREDTIALWREITGVSTDDLPWYEDFAVFKLLCLGTNMMNLRGLAPAGSDYAAMPWAQEIIPMLRPEMLA